VNRKSLIAAALALLVATTVLAQMPPGKWWRQQPMVTSLQLTEDQQEKLESVFRGSANELIDLKGEVEKANIALRGELDQPQLNRQNILRAATRLNEAQGRKFARELAMLVDMRGVLTDAQWNRMRNQLDRVGDPNKQPRRNGMQGPRPMQQRRQGGPLPAQPAPNPPQPE
jgi:hypothetical protein